MSLNNAINTAGMGLRSTQTLSRVNSENVANSATEGYVRRRALTTSGPNGSGPVVAEIRREVDSALSRMSRNELGKMAKQEAIFGAVSNYTAYFGQPGDGLSLSDRYAGFQSSLTSLVNMPASEEAQRGTVIAAEDLVQSLRGASNALAGVRNDVDMEIRYELTDLNHVLYDVAALNKKVLEVQKGTAEAAQIADQMDRSLDKIAGIVDIRIYANTDGSLNIYTSGGAALVERTQVQDITLSAATGQILAGSQDVTPNKVGVRGLSEGSLAGLLALKRDIIPRFQLQLDEFARGLITTFEASDTSLSSGQPGLFTDAGSPLDASKLDNLAARIALNPNVNPSEGGATWRMRDGMAASMPGDASDNTIIQGYISALEQPMPVDPQAGLGNALKISEFGSKLVSAQLLERARSQESFLVSRSSAEIILASRSNFEGVNIDEEMQDLQMIQQSYTANARVLTTVLEMIDTLLTAT